MMHLFSSLSLRRIAMFACATMLFTNVAMAEVTDQQFQDMMQKYLSTDGGKKTLGKAVESYFMDRQKEAQQQKAAEEAKAAEDQFKNPVKIELGNSPAKGPANAKITIVEFSDFQCPFCKRGRDYMEEVMKMYPNDVRLVFKHLPLEFHQEAEPAARAAIAAGNQGKFWEMYMALFDNQQKIGSAFYLEQAKTLGLNVEKFQKDLTAETTTAVLKADKAIAQQNKIEGTPGFFVNGIAVRGAYPPEHFKGIIDRLLGGGEQPKKAA